MLYLIIGDRIRHAKNSDNNKVLNVANFVLHTCELEQP